MAGYHTEEIDSLVRGYAMAPLLYLSNCMNNDQTPPDKDPGSSADKSLYVGDIGISAQPINYTE